MSVVSFDSASKSSLSISIREFGKARTSEIHSLLSEINLKKSNNLLSQRMPIHLRRRSSSRKFSKLNKNKTVYKVSKRKFNKLTNKHHLRIIKNKNINSKVMKMATHIWHAKRFHIINKFGMSIPFCCTSKNYHLTFNSIKSGSILQDLSYFCFLRVTFSSPTKLIECLKKHLFFNKIEEYLDERVSLFFENIEDKTSLIGPVLLTIQDTGTVLYLWCHPLCKYPLTKCFEEMEGKVCCLENVSRFRLIGPLSIKAVLTILKLPSIDKETLLLPCDFSINQCFGSFIKYSDVNPHYGALYQESVRNITTEDIKKVIISLTSNKLQDLYEELCSGMSSASDTFPMIVMVKNDPTFFISDHSGNLMRNDMFFGADCIFPSSYAKKLLNFFAKQGVRVGGLREYHTIARECYLHSFPVDYPDLHNVFPSSCPPYKSISKRKIIFKLRIIDTYEKKIQNLLKLLVQKEMITAVKSNLIAEARCDAPVQILRSLKDIYHNLKNCIFSPNQFLPIGIEITNKGYPSMLDGIYACNETANLTTGCKKNSTKNISKQVAKANSLIGYTTDGSISLTIGRGVGRGVVLANAFCQLPMKNDNPHARCAYIKGSKNEKYYAFKTYFYYCFKIG